MLPASSPQLDAYLCLRGEGCSVGGAADESGLPADEAWEAEAAVQRGELKFPKFTRGEKEMPKHDQVEEVVAPDFERALKVMLHDVAPAKEADAKARGDQSAAWSIVEKECHCNKSAAKAFLKLRGMSEELRDDWLRTLYGLMDLAKIGISADLVDRMTANGEAPKMPVVESRGLGTESLATAH